MVKRDKKEIDDGVFRTGPIQGYCPFRELPERLAERNRKAIAGIIDLSELRAGVFPLIQYAELVRPKEVGDLAEDVIETVTLNQVKERFNGTFNSCIEVLKNFPEGLIELDRLEIAEGGIEGKKAREEKILLEAFGFKEQDDPFKSVELVPRRTLRFNH